MPGDALKGFGPAARSRTYLKDRGLRLEVRQHHLFDEGALPFLGRRPFFALQRPIPPLPVLIVDCPSGAGVQPISLFEPRHSLLGEPAGMVETRDDRRIRRPAVAVLACKQARPSQPAEPGTLLTLEDRLCRIG